MNEAADASPDRRLQTVGLILANTLTLLRLVVACLFPFLGQTGRAIGIVVGAISDWLDGPITRSMHATSFFGRVMDPIADKSFALSVVGTLIYDMRLPLWAAGLVLARDIAVAVASLVLLLKDGLAAARRVRPRTAGKICTSTQFVFFFAWVVYEPSRPYLLAVCATASLIAAVDYVIVAIRTGAEPPPEQADDDVMGWPTDDGPADAT